MPENKTISEHETRLHETKNRIRKKKKTFSYILGVIVLVFVAAFNIENYIDEPIFANHLDSIQILLLVFVSCIFLFVFWHLFSIILLKKRANKIKKDIYKHMKLSSDR